MQDSFRILHVNGTGGTIHTRNHVFSRLRLRVNQSAFRAVNRLKAHCVTVFRFTMNWRGGEERSNRLIWLTDVENISEGLRLIPHEKI